MRIVVRTLALFVGVTAAAGAAVALLSRRWRRETDERLKLCSVVAHTGHGPIEYAIVGDGTPTIVFPGTPGGYDQAIALRGVLQGVGDARLAIIGWSRPGYLRTPLEVGRTPTEQANAAAALLDELGVDGANVIGISGGGPSAIQFALEHPQRATRLVLLAAATQRRDVQLDNLLHGPMTSDALAWLLLTAADVAPPLLLPKEIAGDREGLQRIRPVLSTTFPIEPRRHGIENDGRQLRDLDPLPLERLATPTLVVHGTADDTIPFAEAESAAARIPGARLVQIRGGTHVTAPVSAEAGRAIGEFLGAASVLR
jgi:pimeloyl-ACP methyl ester carboxylesterase